MFFEKKNKVKFNKSYKVKSSYNEKMCMYITFYKNRTLLNAHMKIMKEKL